VSTPSLALELLEIKIVRIGIDAPIFVQSVQLRHVLFRKDKVEDAGVLADSLRTDRLRNGDDPVLQVPSEQNLGR